MRTDPVKYSAGPFCEGCVPARAMESETAAAAATMFMSFPRPVVSRLLSRGREAFVPPSLWMRTASRTQQRLDRAALVHRAVALRHLLDRQGQVEDLAWLDLAVPHEIDQVRQVAPHRRGPAVEVDVREEQLGTVELHAMRHADVADVAAGTRRADRLHHRLLRADALQDRVGSNAAGQFLDPRHALLAALRH